MVLGTAATQAIITGGLSCGKSTSCQGGTSIISGRFSLYCGAPEAAVVVTPASGGSYPMAPGVIGRLYQPVTTITPQVIPNQPILISKDKEVQYLTRNSHVVIDFKMEEFDIKVIREYMVPDSKPNIKLSVGGLTDTSKPIVRVDGKTISSSTAQLTIKVTNIRGK